MGARPAREGRWRCRGYAVFPWHRTNSSAPRGDEEIAREGARVGLSADGQGRGQAAGARACASSCRPESFLNAVRALRVGKPARRCDPASMSSAAFLKPRQIEIQLLADTPTGR